MFKLHRYAFFPNLKYVFNIEYKKNVILLYITEVVYIFYNKISEYVEAGWKLNCLIIATRM